MKDILVWVLAACLYILGVFALPIDGWEAVAVATASCISTWRIMETCGS